MRRRPPGRPTRVRQTIASASSTHDTMNGGSVTRTKSTSPMPYADVRKMFCGLPNGSTMPQRFAASPWSTNVGAIMSGRPAASSTAAASGSSASRAMSFVTNIDATPVSAVSAPTRARGERRRATTCAARRSIMPSERMAPTTASMAAMRSSVSTCTYPAYAASGGTAAQVTSAASTATTGMACARTKARGSRHPAARPFDRRAIL
jgi:hypothetical protein